ncbi:MAG: helix-turn-helix domain-containing protein [Actinomycetota bacterium]
MRTTKSHQGAPVRLLSVEEVADMLQVPVQTIYQWRLRRIGPPSMRVGRYVRFDPGDLKRWIDARKKAS